MLPVPGPELSVTCDAPPRSVHSRAVTRCVLSAFPPLPAGNGLYSDTATAATLPSVTPGCLQLTHLLHSRRTGHPFIRSTLQAAQGLAVWHWGPPKPVPSPTSQLCPSLPRLPAGIPAPSSHRPPLSTSEGGWEALASSDEHGHSGPRSSPDGPPTKRNPVLLTLLPNPKSAICFQKPSLLLFFRVF